MKLFNTISSILNSRFAQLGVIVILVFLLLRQCGNARDAQREANRNLNNLMAQQDSVRHLESKLGNVLAEKSAFELKYDELSEDQEDLIKRLELEKKKRPGVVVQTEIVYVDREIFVESSNNHNGDSSSITFSYNPKLPGTNMLSIGGKIPYRFVSDSSITTGKVNLSIEQKIDLVTGLYRDPKTDRLYVRASTTFPGITFGDIQALDMVDDPSTKKALKSARKPFGVGVSAGYGFVLNQGGYSSGPYIGIGLSYSPKWLQFGK